jgi:cardiolipin synthase A/B
MAKKIILFNKCMIIIKPFFLFFLFAAGLSLNNGCATLPDVSEMINEAPAAQNPRQIVSSKGLLSPEKSKAIMERLKLSVDPTDVLERHTAVMESVTESPLTKGNKVALLADGEATYAAMFEAIGNARAHINLETFILEDDEIGRKFTDLLLLKQAEGVQVNIIYDSAGSLGTPESFFKRLRDGGIQVVEFNPINPLKTHGESFPIHTDHRKILIIDGKVAILGGINISSVYSSSLSGREKVKGEPLPWRDTDIQIEGPAVTEAQKLFLETWLKQKGPELDESKYLPDQREYGNALVRVVGSSPGQDNRITFIVYVSAITFAEHSIHLTNAYFIPDDQIMDAFIDAARRGVDVKIILPSTSDSSWALNAARYNYSELLKAGVKIYERRNALLHAKTAIIDDIWSTVGSTNLDYWSLLSNDEVNAVVLSSEFAVEMEKMFAGDLAESDEIQWDKWKKRSLSQKIKEAFAHLFVRWL